MSGDDPDVLKLATSFVGVLLFDVLEAQARRDQADTQAARRDLIRSTFAVIEGLSWTYREHISSVARDLDDLLPLEEQALAEVSVQVTPEGKVVEQARFLPLLNTIRLISRIAMRLDPQLSISFNGAEWAKFRQALAVRHRITHPKQLEDLVISDGDLIICQAALYWLAETIAVASEAASTALQDYTVELHKLVNDLKAGDPNAIAAYEQAATRLQES